MKIVHFEKKEEIKAGQNRNCISCGMVQEHWQGNFGKGYAHGSETYCCLGCAEGDSCCCEDGI